MQTTYENDHPLSDDNLYQIINQQMQRCLRDIGIMDVNCRAANSFQDMDLCTIHTTTNGGYQIRLVFYADRTFLLLIAQHMLGEPVTDPDDIKECAMEFFNVDRGHIVAAIFRETHARRGFTVRALKRDTICRARRALTRCWRTVIWASRTVPQYSCMTR